MTSTTGVHYKRYNGSNDPFLFTPLHPLIGIISPQPSIILSDGLLRGWAYYFMDEENFL